MTINYGPAGFLSTDDPGADMRQIEAERGPWDEEDYLDDLLPPEEIIYGNCGTCGWWDRTSYRQGDAADFAAAKQWLRGKHKDDRPGCKGSLKFS